MGLIPEYSDRECLLRTKYLLPKASFIRMVFLSIVVVSPGILAGMAMAISGIALPQMKFNIDDASWFGSIAAIGSAVGSILIGLVIDKYGRRPAILLGILPSIVGWFLLSVDVNKTLTFTARFLTGVTGGTTFIGQIYTAECILVNRPHLRNTFNTWDSIATAIGSLFTYILSCLLPYREVASVAAIVSILCFMGIFAWIPESPHWLHKRGRVKEARQAEYDLGVLQPVLNTENVSAVSAPRSFSLMSFRIGLKKLTRKDVYKPMCLMTIWFTLITISGGPSIFAFMVDVLKTKNSDTKHATNTEYQLSVVSGLCFLSAVILLTFVVKRTGIKKLFIGSAFCMALGLVVLGVSEMETGDWQTTLYVIHAVSVWVIIFFYMFGMLTLAGSVVGEMFPDDAKGFASVPMISLCLMCLLSVKMHLYLYAYFKGWLYLIYALVNIVAMLFVDMFVPETVGKTLGEIREGFLN